jgi:hypothetical protein
VIDKLDTRERDRKQLKRSRNEYWRETESNKCSRDEKEDEEKTTKGANA